MADRQIDIDREIHIMQIDTVYTYRHPLITVYYLCLSFPPIEQTGGSDRLVQIARTRLACAQGIIVKIAFTHIWVSIASRIDRGAVRSDRDSYVIERSLLV